MSEFFWMIFGVLLTMVLTAIGYVISARREHMRWIRSERLQAYTAALRVNEAADTMLWLRGVMEETIDAEKAEVESRLSELRIELGGEDFHDEFDPSKHLRTVLEQFYPRGFKAELLSLYGEWAHVNAMLEVVAPDATVQAFKEYSEVSAKSNTSEDKKDHLWSEFRARCQKDLKIGRH